MSPYIVAFILIAIGITNIICGSIIHMAIKTQSFDGTKKDNSTNSAVFIISSGCIALVIGIVFAVMGYKNVDVNISPKSA